jgi:hypothetical protein
LKLARALIVAAICLAPGCASRPRTFFPEANEVRGWSKTGEIRTFEAADLWKYIDGDAEKYIQAGVQRTLAADYRYRNQVEAAADVYVMATAEGARKLLDSESSSEGRSVQIGDAARLYDGSLVFRQGQYFVRLIAYQQTPETGAALAELARAIDAKLRQ